MNRQAQYPACSFFKDTIALGGETMSELIITDLLEDVFTITLNHPPTNTLNLEMVKLLQGAFKEAASNKQVRAILLRGQGDNFSAGQDIYEILQAEGESYRRHMLETYNPLILQIRRLELPVIAEIHGTVAGAALGITLACDLRIASEEARFLVGFLGIGLAPDSAVSLFLPALIGMGRATEAAFTNEAITAQQALSWGLVNRLTPAQTLQASALAMAQALAKGPIHAMGLTKRDLNKAIYPHLEQVLDYEAHIQEIAHLGGEHREGVRAFVEKRYPNWRIG
jgi:2-(1,2-epoxy-1,2-dihydrophenyl)acetyl-CoA isomerase